VNPFTRRSTVTPAIPETRAILELEARGAVLETWTSDYGTSRRTSKTFTTVEDADAALFQRILKARRRGYRLVGPSEVLVPKAADGSTVLLDELFAAGDADVLREILACTSEKKLAVLAVPWMNDARPEMRRALFDYIDDGCDRFGHKALVKRLYKLAEAKGDDELLAHFMVAFDRLSARRLVQRRRSWRRPAGNVLVSDPVVDERLTNGRESTRFTRATRRYLARRAFRYFRRLGKSDPARYGRAIRAALTLYEDEHLNTAEKLLDSWGLLHALYAWSNVIDRSPRGVVVSDGQVLKDLAPAPYWPAAWRGVEDELFALLRDARSRPVRAWVVAWLRKEYPSALEQVPVPRVLLLLRSPNEEAVTLGAELLPRATGLATLTVDVWKDLLAIQDLDALLVVSKAFETHVARERLSLADAVALALSSAAPVAELGLRWAKAKGAEGADLRLLSTLGGAPVETVRAEGVAWLLSLFEADGDAKPGRALILRDLMDSRFIDVRRAACAFVSRAEGDASLPLWLALVESPYDDVRALVVKHAAEWEREAGPGELRHVAATVILAVHRGASAKQAMFRRIADRVARKPEDADQLLPLLGLALRSVRPSERTGALLAIARAAVSNERLREAVSRHFPGVAIDVRVSA
jgi:hypothetical protein